MLNYKKKYHHGKKWLKIKNIINITFEYQSYEIQLYLESILLKIIKIIQLYLESILLKIIKIIQ